MERGAFIGLVLLAPLLMVAASPVLLEATADSLALAGEKVGLVESPAAAKKAAKKAATKAAQKDKDSGLVDSRFMVRGETATEGDVDGVTYIGGRVLNADGTLGEQVYQDADGATMADRTAMSVGSTTGRSAGSADTGASSTEASATDAAATDTTAATAKSDAASAGSDAGAAVGGDAKSTAGSDTGAASGTDAEGAAGSDAGAGTTGKETGTDTGY